MKEYNIKEEVKKLGVSEQDFKHFVEIALTIYNVVENNEK